ncbi:TCP-1/cpn60 chaperonin family protein [Candidatus Bathyarchaeota archaeon]|nr:TCP-1/cpn60 chaperonin family protein [Candidatus Bathyarchaeota archaeon]MBS7636107.1 TCP-1/cpn60 chaperonin family protein [Candidatus Bathyarchaeota archaeon]
MSSSASAGVPVLILKEGSTRSRGREAQHTNIMAARIIAETVKSSLGPKGMDKMLVDSFGDVTITSDGRTILDEMDVQHPAAKMMVEVAKTQDNEAGDGTTTAVILAGELLAKAEELIGKNIHPTIIIDGYKKAMEKSLEILEKIAIPVDLNSQEYLRKAAMTSMASKLVAEHREYLADLAVGAILQVAEKEDGKYKVDVDDVKVEKKPGESVRDTMLINGIVLDKEVVHSGMPKRVENAKIALLDCPLEIEKTEFDAKINIESPEQMDAFLRQEEAMLKDMVEKLAAVGANVVLCQKGIDDMAQHFLARKGILAVRRIKKSDMEKLAKATGGKIITNLDDMSPADLGYASLVEERKIGDDKMTFVEGCKHPRAVTILIRGATERVVEEAERSVHDALCVVRDIVEEPKILAGGGAPELEIARALKKYAETLPGREQLAVKSFAEALEAIPATLTENAGLDPIDILSELRAKHEKGETWAGIEVHSGKVQDMREAGVFEPISVKKQVVKSATEAASMILKIDDVIAAGKAKTPPMPPKGPSEGEY